MNILARLRARWVDARRARGALKQLRALYREHRRHLDAEPDPYCPECDVAVPVPDYVPREWEVEW